jgi:polysaccharide biosynthesis/export protein
MISRVFIRPFVASKHALILKACIPRHFLVPSGGHLSFFLILALSALLFPACSGIPVKPGTYGPDMETPHPEAAEFVRLDQEVPGEMFTPGTEKTSTRYASQEQVETFSAGTSTDYFLGPGDKFSFQVRGRQDISVEQVIVSPDGFVSLPRIGIMKIEGMSLKQATDHIIKNLKNYYEHPDVTLVMLEYNNNKAYVLGRVANPGAVHFDGPGTVLEALALAGGLPADTQKTFLNRCMIVRGNELVMWIDLRDLLENGNMALNARLQNGDVVFIPQSEDAVAYVMGEVINPGLLLLRTELTVLDAIMNAGGMTRNADPGEVFLVRSHQGTGMVEEIDFTAFIQRGDLRKNYVLREGDILYVGERGMSRFNYFITQLLPSMQVIDFTLETAERFGAMQELRRKIWGQEGFISN